MSSTTRRCALCGNPIGTLNRSGVCRSCRIYVTRRAPLGASLVAALVAGPNATPVCCGCGREALTGNHLCVACQAAVDDDAVRAGVLPMPAMEHVA